MSKISGFDLLRKQVIDRVTERFADLDDVVRGDSEIERLFCAALICRVDFGPSEYNGILLPEDSASAERLRSTSQARYDLIVESQVQIDRFRADFIISAWNWGTLWSQKEKPVVSEPRWRKLVVECDGHDFHERTKEQAAKDRSRDRHLNAAGYDVFRFTGSELWRDPWGCADQVIDWAARGI